MEISIVCTKLKKAGGIEAYTMSLINGFYNSGFPVNVYSISFDKKIDEYRLITPKKVNLSFIPKKLRLPFFSMFVNKNKKDNEVIVSTTHINSDIIICGGQQIGYLNALNKKPSLLDRFKIFNEKKSFQSAKVIVAHSQLMKNELVKFYKVHPDKVKVVYPPVNVNKFFTVDSVKREILRRKFGFSSNEIIYVFPSTGHKRKGFKILEEYFNNSELPIRLVVVGSPVKESKNVTYLGFCNNMSELYRAADFTIMASIYEPFGLVGIESILSGTPIIFSENMACLEVINDGYNLSFKRDDIDSLHNSIVSSIGMVTHNQARIKEPLDIINYKPDLSAHIEELLKIINSINDI